MIWVITLIAGLISIIVVLSVVALSLAQVLIGSPIRGEKLEIPDVLSNWGGIILGFYFGQFINLVKDYIGLVNASSPQPPKPQP
jgi:hypothetical protein